MTVFFPKGYTQTDIHLWLRDRGYHCFYVGDLEYTTTGWTFTVGGDWLGSEPPPLC